MPANDRRRSCRYRCPNNGQCSLVGQTHTWHICSDPDCVCHTQMRYEAERKRDEVLAAPVIQEVN